MAPLEQTQQQDPIRKEITGGLVKLFFSLIFLALSTACGLLYNLNINFGKMVTAREYEQKEKEEFKRDYNEFKKAIGITVGTIQSNVTDHEKRIDMIEYFVKPDEVRITEHEPKKTK